MERTDTGSESAPCSSCHGHGTVESDRFDSRGEHISVATPCDDCTSERDEEDEAQWSADDDFGGECAVEVRS